ncbi:HGL122Cp [Eremothecium sinecaudum]|uniref:HGL122Cp n=1 Tax=Eremothecium sinecaudum TaxID=45286 RepID=A0A120K2P8_9SACH|nr:HGL122Cp [Eremothecium sinecaudum]AMD22218.1 HGL122Cp [Eremothecium sinecaudum]
MSFNLQKYQKSLVYKLADEYLLQAHAVAGRVNSEESLKEYYTLVQQAIRGYQYVKEGFQLSLEQDFQVTVALVSVLLDETHEIELAEQYLNSLHTRLQRTTYTDHKYVIQFYLLYQVPMHKNSVPEIKNAVRGLGRLIASIEENEPWRLVFQYCRVALMEKSYTSSKNPDHITEEYCSIIEQCAVSKSELYGFAVCSFVTFLLSKSLPIDGGVLDKLKNLRQNDSTTPKLRLWGLLLDLLVAIKLDENITVLLTDFKEFFSHYKSELDNSSEKLSLQVKHGLELALDLPFFNYTDCKNILLLFQSVSYLTNCYSKKSNFSTKFLPKVLKSTAELKSSFQRKTSVSRLSYLRSIYDSMIELCHFYQMWEFMILSGPVKGEFPQFSDPDYYTLLEAMNSHMAIENESEHVTSLYKSIIRSKNLEVRLIAMIHNHVFCVSQLSKCQHQPEVISDLTHKVNDSWKQLVSSFQNSILCHNRTWQCTIACLWIISRFEPFTGRPLPKDDEKEVQFYMDQLNGFFSQNALLPEIQCHSLNESEIGQYTLKKSLLLHFILNYLGGSILVSDINDRCNLSASCFQISKNQHMPFIRYLGGIWHLMNCAVTMNGKELAITRAKLENLVKELGKS